MYTKIIRWVNTIAFSAMIIINLLANLLPFGGKTTGQISDAYPNLFTPAGITFSIWGVIYILLGVFILYQWGLFGYKEESSTIVTKTGILFTVSCLFNILWVLFWHKTNIGWSVLCIAGLLAALIMIQSEIQSGPSGIVPRLAVNAGFDIYYGWLIAAVPANISVWLVKSGWNRFGLSETFWTSAVILAGAAIGSCVVLIGRNRLAGLAVIWAYTGILIKHLSAAGYAGQYPIIITMTILGIVCILASILLTSIVGSLFCRYLPPQDFP